MFTFTPGPTQPHPKLFEFLEEAKKDDIFSLSHRSTYFQSFFHETQESLKRLLHITEPVHIFFVGSATECMERVLENCVEAKSLHLVNGAFSRRMYECAVELKKTPILIEQPLGVGFDLKNISIHDDVELLTLCHCETSGCTEENINDLAEIKKQHPELLIALDVVTTVPYATLDFTVIDCAFFSVQKGFGLPAGMGVLIINDRCMEKARLLQEKGLSIGTYHHFLNLLSYEKNNYTPETPNILGIYLLGKASAYYEKNSDEIRHSTEGNAHMIYDFLEHQHILKPFVANPEKRSKIVVSIATPWGSEKLIEHCKNHGFLIGSGYGKDKDKLARIANFPMHTEEKMHELINVLQGFTI